MDLTRITKSPIMLKEENKRFSLDQTREMRGYMKLETDGDKGMIVVTVDNVKFFPKGEYVYKLIFAGIKNEKKRYHMTGNISLSAYGTGEGSFRINLNDMDGNGTALWDFSTVIIAAMSTINFREALHPIMKGDLMLSKEETTKKTAEPKDYSPFYNKFVLGNCIEIAKNQEKFADIIPFDQDLTNAKWKRITDFTLFPMISPGSQAPMKKYGHFLYGWHDSHYFLGIPGRFLPGDQPDKGKSGFVFWQPIMGMEKENEDKAIPIEERRKNIYGYWIASINRHNGHIEEFIR